MAPRSGKARAWQGGPHLCGEKGAVRTLQGLRPSPWFRLNLSPCPAGGPPGRARGRGTSPRTAAPAAGRVLKCPGRSHLQFCVGTFLLEKRVASSSTATSCSQSAVNINALLHTPATALGSHFLCPDPVAAGRWAAYLRGHGVTYLLLHHLAA